MDRPDDDQTPPADAYARWRHWPLLTFNYGLQPETIARMPRALLVAYLEELPKLQAAQQVAAIQAASVPHMDEDSRNQVMAALRTAAGAEPLSVEDGTPLADIVEAARSGGDSGIGFGVNFVPVAGGGSAA